MQGQGSSSNSFPETFYFRHGANANDLGLDQHNMVLDASAQGRTMISGEYSSSVNIQNQFSSQQLLSEDNWDSYPADHAGKGQRFEERHPEQNVAPLQESVNMSLVNGHVRNGQLASPGPSSCALPHCVDLNATYQANGNDTNQDMGAGQALDPLKPGDSESDNQPATYSSNPLIISSGIEGYGLEENHGREGSSNNGRRLPCKRRAPEDASGQLTVGGSSSSVLQAGNTKEHAVTAGEQLDAGRGVGMQAASITHQASSVAATSSGVAAPDTRQTSSVAGEVENFQRNIRPRTANLQDVVPESRSTWTPRNSDVQSSNQPAEFFPFYWFLNTSSVPVHAIPAVPPVVNWVSGNMSITEYQFPLMQGQGSTSNSFPETFYFRHGANANDLGLDQHNMVLDASAQGRTMISGEYSSSVNIQNQFNSQRLLSEDNWDSYPAGHAGSGQRFEERQPERNIAPLQESVNMSLVSVHVRNGQSASPGPSSAALSHHVDLNATYEGNGNVANQYNGAGQADDYAELPPALHYLAASQSSVLISEDASVVNPSGLHGVPEEQEEEEEEEDDDDDEDMRLDVDNMTYEELLDLEENIGKVCTGLSEEAILENLRQCKYQYIAVWPPVEDEQCCICLECYDDAEDLGKLDCGHEFHFSCIKQWLMQKNSCPICTMKALAVTGRDQ